MQKPQFLLVDDSKAALYALQTILKPLDADIFTANGAEEGCEVALNREIDLVITDVDMPGMNGLDFCQWIKTNPETERTPVIILSSCERDEDIDMGFKVGADAYVPKSMASIDILPRIKQIMDKRATTGDRLILLVDDSSAIRTIVSDGLRKQGFKVLAAKTAEEALKTLSNVIPDLILTDLSMPGMGGRGLCNHTLKSKTLASIPIVVMSSTSDQGIMQRMIQEGIAAFVTKPIGINNLIQILERILSEQFHTMRLEQKRLITERNMTLGSITSLARALEIRDLYTRGHSESVTRISMGIAGLLGFQDDQLSKLRISSLLHDLGKIGIRDDVLLKPGKLTEDEFEHIKGHTTMVADILAPLPGMEEVLQAASSHHERWNGSGYPKGLAGEDIPFFGRIIAVADVFDALTSDRVYRKRLTTEDARKIIADGREVMFCPRCVDAFLKWYEMTHGPHCLVQAV